MSDPTDSITLLKLLHCGANTKQKSRLVAILTHRCGVVRFSQPVLAGGPATEVRVKELQR